MSCIGKELALVKDMPVATSFASLGGVDISFLGFSSLKKSIWLTKCLGFQLRRERSQTEVSPSDFGKVGCSFRVAEKFIVICLILLH